MSDLKSYKTLIVKKSYAWPIAMVAIVFILASVFIFYQITSAVKKPIDAIKEVAKSAFETKVKITYVIKNTRGQIKKETKLVVMTAEVDANTSASSEKSKFWVNLGTTTVEIKATGNKVQYILPTSVINQDNFSYNEATGEINVKLPSAILDESFVEVQSNPNKIEVKKTIGWARLSSYSGAYLENQLKKNLRDSVIQSGKNELLLDKANRNAEEVVLKILQQVLQKENINVKVNFN